jgi:hypothetical protein
VVALSLAKRPESRYQNGDQFAADLRWVLAEMTGLPPNSGFGPVSGFGAPTSGFGPLTGREADAGVPAAADKTVVMSAPRSPRNFEPALAASAMSGPGAPGYDQNQKAGETADDFAKTAVIRKPAAPDSPGAGDHKKDLEG